MCWRGIVVAVLAVMAAPAVLAEPERDQIDLANGLFQRGIFDMAADAYRGYIEKYPQGAHVKDALNRLGECELSLKQYEAALSRFDKYIEIETDPTARQRALLRRGELLYRLKHPDEAVQVLQPLAGPSTGDPEVRAGARYYLGLAHCDKEAYPAAVEVLKALVGDAAGGPLVPYAHYRLGGVYVKLNDPKKAAVEFAAVADDAAADADLRAEARFRAAEAYDQGGWYDQAVAAYQKLEAEYPNTARAGQAALGFTWALYHAGKYADAAEHARGYIEQHPNTDAVPGLLYLQGNCLQQQKKYDAALAVFNDIRARHPQSEFAARALYKIAWTQYLTGNTAEAQKTINAFLDAHKNSPLVGEAAFLRGLLLIAGKDYENAQQEFRYVAERYPQSEFGAEALYKVGECLAQLGKTDEAVSVFRSFVKQFPQDPLVKEALIRIGDVKFSSALFEDAIAEYKQILANNPDPAAEESALYRLAIAYNNLKRAEESAATFQTLIDKYPAGRYRIEADARLGDYYLYDAKDPVKSIAYHQAALDADPKGAFAGEALKGLALARYDTKDQDGAADLFLRLMKEYASVKLNEQAYLWVAERCFDQQKWDAAALAFGALLTALPDYPNPERVRCRIAECAEKAGNAREALKLYQAVADETPKSASAVKARYRMAVLHEGLKETDAAMHLYELVASTDSGDVAAQARFRLAEMCEAKQDYATAAKHYMFIAIVLLHEKLSPEAMWRAGQCLEKTSGGAKKVYQDLVSEFPNSEQAEKAKARLAELG